MCAPLTCTVVDFMNPQIIHDKMMQLARSAFLFASIFFAASICADDTKTFRTDASTDESLPWYELVDGQFPPAGSAHYFTGELIGLDPVERTGKLRVSRTDEQRRSHWDLPTHFEMLPYAAVELCGTKAAFRDIPLGTHLHGLWYERDKSGPEPKTEFYNRKTIEAEFTRCFRLQDDFSYWQGRGIDWQIEKVDLAEMKLTCTQMPIGELMLQETGPVEYDLLPSTRVWIDDRLTGIKELKEGQRIQFRLTWATLYGAGRLTDIWANARARELATERQRIAHEHFTKERGLAGWIEDVDNSEQILTITLFDIVEPKLLEQFLKDATVQTIVAEPSLRNYDQVNDRKGGRIVETKTLDPQPGSSGHQIKIRVDLLLEGFRPGKIVRVFGPGWKVLTLPQEENLWPARD